MLRSGEHNHQPLGGCLCLGVLSRIIAAMRPRCSAIFGSTSSRRSAFRHSSVSSSSDTEVGPLKLALRQALNVLQVGIRQIGAVEPCQTQITAAQIGCS